MKKLILLALLLCLASYGVAQIHRKVPKLQEHYEDLDQLNDHLEQNHIQYLKKYKPLYKLANRTKNEDLLSILYLFHGYYWRWCGDSEP